MKKEKGFTLIETIATISLGILVMTLVTSVVNSQLRYLREVKNDETLHSNAIFIFDNLNYLIKRGEPLTTVFPSDSLQIKLSDSSIETITKSGTNITINGIPFNSSKTEVTSLNFLKIGKSIRVGLTLKIKKSESYFSATTTIAQRSI